MLWLLHAFGAGSQCEHQPNCKRAASAPPDLTCFSAIKRPAAPSEQRLLDCQLRAQHAPALTVTRMLHQPEDGMLNEGRLDSYPFSPVTAMEFALKSK